MSEDERFVLEHWNLVRPEYKQILERLGVKNKDGDKNGERDP